MLDYFHIRDNLITSWSNYLKSSCFILSLHVLDHSKVRCLSRLIVVVLVHDSSSNDYCCSLIELLLHYSSWFSRPWVTIDNLIFSSTVSVTLYLRSLVITHVNSSLFVIIMLSLELLVQYHSPITDLNTF